jgi:site-specific DNA-cytosine methylase
MPLCIDLFCGLGGWTEGFLAEGWDVIGFDIARALKPPAPPATP